jgi:prophage regulatory protein
MRILRPPQSAEKLGIAVSTLWAKARNEPTFPQPVKISESVTGWVESELDDYLSAKIREYREQPKKRQGAFRAAEKSAAKRAALSVREADHEPA